MAKIREIVVGFSEDEIDLFILQNVQTNLRNCIVHVDNIKFFICPTNAHNSYKIVKQLNSLKIFIVVPTCFRLHKPSSGISQSVFRRSYNVDIVYIYRYLKLSVLWLHILFSPVIGVDRALCRVELCALDGQTKNLMSRPTLGSAVCDCWFPPRCS